MGTSIVDSLGIEGTLNYFNTKSKKDASTDTGYLFRIDAIYPFILGVKWMPFLAVGGGGIIIKSVAHPDKSPLFNYGVGLKYFLEDYLAVRADARHLVIYDNNTTRNNIEVGIGISYYFGKESKKKPVPPPPPKQEEKKDTTIEEKTNGTATNGASAIPVLEEKKPVVNVETPAVSPPPPIVPPIAPAPSLPLESAAKPLIQAEEPVRQPAGKKVVRKLTIGFDFNSSYIKPEFNKVLKEIADIMKNSADATARIEGHTDTKGEVSFNSTFSDKRAQRVQSKLIELGIDPGRITAEGYGSSRPIADNATKEGRKKNRRAETFITLTVYE
jgi:OOP family OmpA-OmpF porin